MSGPARDERASEKDNLLSMATKTQRALHSASGILALLESRHAKDVFIPECKDGPTHSASHLRMDGWAMTKSWAHPSTIGYEIKVSRSDFLQDNKWPAYLPLCNQFYFVAPKNLIDPSELSADVGLLVVAGDGDGTRLLTKKKAAHRDVEIPDSLWRYILMCRVQIADEKPLETTVERWRNWLARKQEDRYLGYEVSKAIREKAKALETENQRLTLKMKTYDRLLGVLAHYGVSPDSWHAERDLDDKLQAARKVFDPALVGQMRSLEFALRSALCVVDEMERESSTQDAVAASALFSSDATEGSLLLELKEQGL